MFYIKLLSVALSDFRPGWSGPKFTGDLNIRSEAYKELLRIFPSVPAELRIPSTFDEMDAAQRAKVFSSLIDWIKNNEKFMYIADDTGTIAIDNEAQKSAIPTSKPRVWPSLKAQPDWNLKDNLESITK